MKIFLIGILLLSSALAEKTQQMPYNQTSAIKYWDFACIAGCDISNILSMTCGEVCQNYKNELQFIEVAYYNPDQFLAWLSYSSVDDVIYIVFRGSMTFENWIHDFEYLKIPYQSSSKYPYPEQNISCKDCEVHNGFYHSYIDIRPKLLASLASVSQKSNCTKIQIVGYSLGAAIGNHCSLDLLTTNELKNKYKTLGIYTVGCPRMGNIAFANYFDGIVPTAYRVVHYQDIVPHLPLEIMGFYHTEQEVWYTSEENLDHVFCQTGEDPNCSDKEKVLKPSDHTSYFNKPLENVMKYCSQSSFIQKKI